MNKNLSLMLCIVFITSLCITLISSAPPIFSTEDAGYIIEPTIKDYIRTGEDHEFEIHVFNKTTGLHINSGISCYMHLYHDRGNHIYEGYDETANHDFDYAFDLNGSNFTNRGIYQAKFQCNSSTLGGGIEIQFGVNDYGEELTEEATLLHNYSMMFLMVLFAFALFGLIKMDNLALKFALYWVCHIFFVIGTFAVWQFNQGYTLNHMATAGIFRVLFYVSIIAMLPMMILSIAWMIYITATSKEVERLIDKGFDPVDAEKRAGRKRR